jgi:PAS domain S-box-containing protein
MELTENPHVTLLQEQLKLYQDLVETSQDLTWQCDAEGRYTYLNPVWETTFGYTVDEMLGRKFTDFQVPEPHSGGSDECGLFFRGDRITGYETMHRGKSGNTIHLVINAKYIRGADGEIIGARGTAQDISERKKAEEVLHQQSSLQRTLMELSSTYINLPLDAVDSTIDVSLGKLARFVGADRSYIFDYDFNKQTCSNTHEWCDDGIEPQIGELQDVPLALLPGWVETHLRGEPMYVPNVPSLPPGGMRLVLEPQGIISMLTVPLISTGELIGFAGFDSVRRQRTYSDIEQHLLMVFAHMLVNIRQRKRAEEALRENEEKYRGLVENSPDAIVMHVDGTIVFVNNECVRLMGAVNKEELIGKPIIQFIHSDTGAHAAQQMTDADSGGTTAQTETEIFFRVDGTAVDVEVKAIPTIYEHKPAVQVIIRDITERKRLEQQLLQSQKLEGVGTLAGGIAHDFNNLLAMVLGSAELLQRQLSELPQLKKYVDRIIEASERGSSISRQLLIFSRPDQAKLMPISLSHTISELQEMLKHFLPKSIEITTSIDVDHGIIMGDGGQIHQALLNLALNAGDAMTHHGTLSVKEFSVPAEFIRKKFSVESVVPHVAVSVSDTGTGMDDSVIAKIFDPFFSTKERGKGTGLGLAMVHGIVKNHNGFIDVTSAVGEGTTFTLYFPSVIHSIEAPCAETVHPPQQHEETILLVDDEEHLREMLTEYLGDSGYQILAASNGTEALDLFRTHHRSIDLVITDLGMPHMGGEELFRRLKEIDTGVKVMVSSGYLDGITREHLLHLGIKDVLTKPSKLQDIQQAIRTVLGVEAHVQIN